MVFSHCLFQRKIRQKWKKRNILQFNNVRFDLAFFAKCRKLNFESAKTIEFSPIFFVYSYVYMIIKTKARKKIWILIMKNQFI